MPFSAGCAAKSAARCIPYVQVAQQKQSNQHMSPEEIFQIVLIFILSARSALGEAASPFWITRDPLPQNWPPARKHARRHVLSREQRRQGVMQYDNAGCAARCEMHGKMHTVSPGNKQRQSRQTKPLGGDVQISSNEALLKNYSSRPHLRVPSGRVFLSPDSKLSPTQKSRVKPDHRNFK